MSILVVDDDLDTRRLVALLLRKAGHSEVVTLDSGEEACAYLGIESSTQPMPSVELILVDYSMRGVNGIEMIRRIKSDARWQDVPIIMVTGDPNIERLDAAFEAGAVDYIMKPLNRVELRARVRSALRLKHEMARRVAREQELIQVSKQLEEANRLLSRIALIDGLTGVANRRQFESLLTAEWGRALRETSPLTFLLIDIDQFKAYNDTYGHQQGDTCLKLVADTLAAHLNRAADSVARYGGEEFAVILPATDAAGAQEVGERLRSAVEKLAIPHRTSPIAPWVTISGGAATLTPRISQSPDTLVALADGALYQAKRDGRNRVVHAVVPADLPIAK